MKTTSASQNLVFVVAFLFFLALAVLPAHAATYTVTSNADAGPGSLRQAILDANANAGSDIINFAPALNGQKILLTGGYLDVSESVSILGPGPNQLAIDGNGSSRAFYLNPGQTNLIAGLTITNGHQANKGGGIYNEMASLTVSNVALRGNSAGYAGGAIYNDRGTLTLQYSTLSDNSAGGGGAGAIFNTGGDGLTAKLTLQNCTLSGNSSELAGGVIYTVSRYPFVGDSGNATLTLQNCTLSGNSAQIGGGIYCFAYSSNVVAVTVQHCTFSGNSTSNSSSGSIDISKQADSTATLTITHTLLAHGVGRNFRNSGVFGGTVTNLGYNLSDDNSTTSFATTVTNLFLSPLANNGGPTLTHALLPESPAVHAGDPGFTGPPTYDQRGPGFPRVLFGRIDIGALEATCSTAITVVSTNDSGPGTLRQALTDICLGGGTITFAPALNGKIITLTSGQLAVTKNVSIVGPGPGQLAVRRSTAGGTPAFRLLAVNSGVTATVSGLTLSDGNSADGGGLRNDGTLSVSNCVIASNTGTGNGGGIYNVGTLTVTDCTLSNNTSAASGGAITQPSGGSTTLTRCTFSGNSAVNGGALFNQAFNQFNPFPISIPAYMNVTNCTFSGNTGTSAGSAAYNVANSAPAPAQILMQHCTVFGNPGTFALFNVANGAQAFLLVGGSIVGNNGNGPDTGGAGTPVISQGYNLISRADGFAAATGDRMGTVTSPLNPLLGPLANNGGPTLTHLPLFGSPAFDAGNTNTSGFPAADQRGPGFPRILNGRIDMGAVESQAYAVNPVAFNGSGLNWSANQIGTYTTPAISNNVLRLTDGAPNEARSVFYHTPQYVGAFRASFTYQDIGGGGADGVAFVLQNDTRTVSALGGAGGGLGFSGITNSVALELNIYTGNNQVAGYTVLTNGLTAAGGANGNYRLPGGINLASGNPIHITVNYANGRMALQFVDAVANETFATNLFVGNLTNIVRGETAYIGFTGADGGVASTQIITDFSYASIPTLAMEVANGNATLTWPASIGGYVLQANTDFSTTNWVNVTNLQTVVNGKNQVILPATPPMKVFRLMLP